MIMDTLLKFEDAAAALSLDYVCVFYVDVKASDYVVLDFYGKLAKLNLKHSHNFWADISVISENLVYSEDKDSFMELVKRASAVSASQESQVVNYKCRLMVDGVPAWFVIKAAITHSRGRDFLFIGVNNIDTQEREQIELKSKASKSEIYSQIAMALTSRFDALYMVNLKTKHFAVYKSECAFGELKVGLEGDDFFNRMIRDAAKSVYKDDYVLAAESLKEEALLKELDDYGTFTLTFRSNSAKGPVYVKLIAGYTDKDHIAISITNVDAQVRRELKLRSTVMQNEVYGQIVMALAERYDALYMLDLKTDHYALFKSERMFSKVKVAAEGEDFFNQLQKDAEKVVYSEDIHLVQSALLKESFIKELDENGLFMLKYRLNSTSGPIYVNLEAVYSDKKHVVISVTNIDAQVRREQRIRAEADAAHQKACRDDLTGIKNKNAYGEFERRLNDQIESGEIGTFAIAICDVNGLKTVNDTMGHKAGDEYIKAASKLVCDTFKHSPVFRVGGDEFVAILKGDDFESRDDLAKTFMNIAKHNAEEEKVVVACGISVFDKKHDKNVSEVFERADALMYKNKIALKSCREEILNAANRAVAAKAAV